MNTLVKLKLDAKYQLYLSKVYNQSSWQIELDNKLQPCWYWRKSLVFNNNFYVIIWTLQNMTATFFFWKKIIFFWRYALRHQNSHLWNTTVATSVHNCHIFGTRESHLWNATCWPCGEESDYNTLPVLITTLWLFKYDNETGTAVAQFRMKIRKNGKWWQHRGIIR